MKFSHFIRVSKPSKDPLPQHFGSQLVCCPRSYQFRLSLVLVSSTASLREQDFCSRSACGAVMGINTKPPKSKLQLTDSIDRLTRVYSHYESFKRIHFHNNHLTSATIVSTFPHVNKKSINLVAVCNEHIHVPQG